MADKVLEAKDPYFKQIATVELGSQCTAFGITHKYGLTCLCLENHLCLIHTEELLVENVGDLFKTKIPCQTLACNEEILVVGYGDNVVIYSYPAVIQDVPKPLHMIKAKSTVKKLIFNPTDNSMVAVLSDDGNLLLTKVNMSGTGFQNWTLNDNKIVSFCFSPKGKQLVVGHESGDLTQLKLDLTVAKKIKGPGGIPVSILWISTTQFLVMTLTANQQDISLVQVDLHKGQPLPTYANFGDAFLSESIDKDSQAWFNINHETIACASTTSTEVVVLVKTQDGNWRIADDIEDKRRAALPLDNFATGGVLYYNYRHNVTFSESENYGEMPVYLIGSKEAKFSAFNFVNKGGLGEHVKLREGVSILSWQGGQSSQGQSQQALAPISTPQQPAQSFTFNTTQTQPFSFSQQQQQSTPLFGATSGQGDTTLKSLLTTSTTKEFGQLGPPPTQASAPVPSSNLFAEPPPTQGVPKSTSIVKPVPTTQAMATVGSSSTTFPGEGQRLVDSTSKPVQQPQEPPKPPVKEGPSDQLLNKFREFGKKMESHRKTCSSHSTQFKHDEEQLATEMEDRFLSKVQEVEDFVDKIQEACNIQRIAIDASLQKNLTQYSQVKYVQSLEERNRDPKYLQLMKAKPMDPATVRRFRELEKNVNHMKSQIQECRRHFYFAKCPPLKTQTAKQYIMNTIENHGITIKNMQTEWAQIMEQLRLEPSVDELEAGFMRTTLKEPEILVSSADMLEMKDFLRRSTTVKVPASVKADYSLTDGVLVNREGISEGSKPKVTLPPLPSIGRTMNMSTQTDLLASEIEKMTVSAGAVAAQPKATGRINTVTAQGQQASGWAQPQPKTANDTFGFPITSSAPVKPFVNTGGVTITAIKPDNANATKTVTVTTAATTFQVPKQPISGISNAPPPNVNLFSSISSGGEPIQVQPVAPKPSTISFEPTKTSATASATMFPTTTTTSSSIFGVKTDTAFPKPTFGGGGSFSIVSDTSTASSATSFIPFSFTPERTAATVPATATPPAGSGDIGSQQTPTITAQGTLDLTKTTSTTRLGQGEGKAKEEPSSLTISTSLATEEGKAKPEDKETFKPIFGSSPNASAATFGNLSTSSFLSPTTTAVTSTPVAAASPTTVTSTTTSSGLDALPSFSFTLGEPTKPATGTSASPFGSSFFSFKPETKPESADVTVKADEGSKGSIFGTSFGSVTITEVSASSTTQPSTTSASATITSTGQPLLSFGSLSTSITSPTASTTTTSTSLFGTPAPASSTISSFSFKPADSSATTTATGPFGSSSLFGSPTSVSTAATSPSIFGTTSTSLFGQTSTAPTTGSLFGGGTVTAADTTAKPAFGGPAVFGGSSFGSTPAPAFSSTSSSTTTGSIFGSNVQPASFDQFATQPSFGGPPVFGGSSPFGTGTAFSPTPAAAATQSTASPPSGIFGSSVQPATFGQFAAPSPQPSAFGSPTAQVGGGTSVFGGSPFGTAPAAATPAFGGGSPSGSIFGGGTPQATGFGQFGQQPSMFGGATTPEQKPPAFGGASFSSWR